MLKMMLRDGEGRPTGPINVSDKDRGTLVLEAGPGAHHGGKGSVWRMEIEVEDWNGLPHIAAIRTANCVPPIDWDAVIAGDDDGPDGYHGIHELTTVDLRENEILRFTGIRENVYMEAGMVPPMPGLSYRVSITRDEDGDLVLRTYGEGA